MDAGAELADFFICSFITFLIRIVAGMRMKR